MQKLWLGFSALWVPPITALAISYTLSSPLLTLPCPNPILQVQTQQILCRTSFDASHVTSLGASGRSVNVVLTKNVLKAYCQEEVSGRSWVLLLTQEVMEPVEAVNACVCLCEARRRPCWCLSGACGLLCRHCVETKQSLAEAMKSCVQPVGSL